MGIRNWVVKWLSLLLLDCMGGEGHLDRHPEKIGSFLSCFLGFGL